MKKITSIMLIAVIVTALCGVCVNAAEKTVTLDFNTEEGRAAGSFFGSGCSFTDSDGVFTEGRTVAFLQNIAEDGGWPSASAGNLYNNGLAIKFNSEEAGEAKLAITMYCPDQPYGGNTYSLYYSANDAEFAQEKLPEANGGPFTHDITVSVVKGENTVKLVQGAYADFTGNSWRIDISIITITLPAENTEPEPPVSTEPKVKNCHYDAAVVEGDEYYFRGWVVVENDTVVDVGYRVEGEEPVFSVADQRPDVADYFQIDGAYVGGFDFRLKPSDLPEGVHVLHVVVKTASGAILNIVENNDGFALTGTAKADDTPTPVETPPTADAAVIAVAAVACVALAGVILLKRK